MMNKIPNSTNVIFNLFRKGKSVLATIALRPAPQPEKDLKYPTGLWHYARGLAYTAQGKITEAQQKLEALDLLAHDSEIEQVAIYFNTTQSILQVATEVLTGEIAAKQDKYPRAIAHLRQAVKREDALHYSEPADWSIPARQYLGKALLEENRYATTEQVYREDLAIYPNNAWSLFGLVQSLQAQKKDTEVETIEQQFESAWQYADIQLTASKF